MSNFDSFLNVCNSTLSNMSPATNITNYKTLNNLQIESKISDASNDLIKDYFNKFPVIFN